MKACRVANWRQKYSIRSKTPREASPVTRRYLKERLSYASENQPLKVAYCIKFDYGNKLQLSPMFPSIETRFIRFSIESFIESGQGLFGERNIFGKNNKIFL